MLEVKNKTNKTKNANCTPSSVRTETFAKKILLWGLTCHTGLIKKFTICPEGIHKRHTASELPRYLGPGSSFFFCLFVCFWFFFFFIEGKSRGGGVCLDTLFTTCYIFLRVNGGPLKSWVM